MKTALIALCLLLSGCALAPVTPAFPLLGPDLSVKSASSSETKVLIFNASHPALYALTGSMEVTIDGRGLATLQIGEFVQVLLHKGSHVVDLTHWDLLPFRSSHMLEVGHQDVIVRIHATATSNELRLLQSLPMQSELPIFFRAYRPR